MYNMAKRLKTAFIRADVLTQTLVNEYENADVLSVISKEFFTVSVKDELSGRSKKLLDFGKLTAKVKGLTFLSLTTDNFSTYHRSVAVFERGKLIKIADSVSCGEKPFSPAFGYKTVALEGVKIGVAVGKDVCDPSCVNCFYLSDCDVIVNLCANFYDFSTETVVSALSYIYGLTIVSVNSNKTCVATCGKVELSCAEQRGECEVLLKKRYREITLKRRGIFL